MNSFFHIFVFILSSLSLPFELAAADEIKRKKNQVRLSFKTILPYDVESSVSTKEEEKYVMKCLALSFHKMANDHGNSQNSTIQEIEVEDKLITRIPTAAAYAGLSTNLWKDDDVYRKGYEEDDDYYWSGRDWECFDYWYYGWILDLMDAMFGGTEACWDYDPDCLLNSFHKNVEWQHNFNGCVNESPYKDMNEAYDVTIDVIDDDEQHLFEGIQSKIKVSFQAPVDGLTDEEHDFVMQILEDTYNGLEQDEMKQSTITSTSLETDIISSPLGENGKNQVLAPLALQRFLGNVRSNSDTRRWLINLTATVESATVSRFPYAVPLDVKSIADWENALCDKIAKGPLENLAKITDCKIETKVLAEGDFLDNYSWRGRNCPYHQPYDAI